MTDSLIITQAYKVERLALRCSRFRNGLRIVFCPLSKSRIAWDLIKAKKELRQEQKIYTSMCEVSVSSEELENFLKTQNQISS